MATHLSVEEIHSYHHRTLTPSERLAVSDHIATCDACRQRLAEHVEREGCLTEAFHTVRADLEARTAAPPAHLTEEQLLAYVDGELDEVDREIVEGHLETCPLCAAEVQELRGFKVLMTTYPAKVHSPAGRPTLWERFRALATRPASRVSLQAASVTAVTMLIAFWALGGPWNRMGSRSSTSGPQGDGARPSATIAALRQENDALRRQMAGLSGVQSRLLHLQRENQALRQEREPAGQGRRGTSRSAGAGGAGQLAGAHSPDEGAAPRAPDRSRPATKLELQDGGGELLLDSRGNLLRVQPLPSEVRDALRQQRLKPPVALPALRDGRSLQRNDRGPEPALTIRGPSATVVATSRPTFSWQFSREATDYTVSVMDARGSGVARGEHIQGTEWTPEKPLPSGQVLQWRVTAYRESEQIGQAPEPPAPAARFQILEPAKAVELERARAVYGGSPLTLGVLYAQAGLLEDAEAQFERVVKDNPRSTVARKLLDDVRKLRSGR